MGYETISRAVRNTELEAQQLEHSNRREIVVVPYEYIRFDLGMDLKGSFIGPQEAQYIENELRIRGQLPNSSVVKVQAYDYTTDCVLIYVVDPNLLPVEPGIRPPERRIQ